MKQRRPRFNMVLGEAVQEGLNSIGPSISDAVLFYVQKKTAVRSGFHAVDPEAFDGCLKEIFGCGAEIIEKRILQTLYLKLEVRVRITGHFKFTEEVKKAQRLLGRSDLLMDASLHKKKDAGKSTRKVLTVNNKDLTF